MKISYHRRFKRNYKKRIASDRKLVSQVEKRITRFQQNPQDSTLKDHPLIGAKRGLRAFSITGDIRIVYLPISKTHVIFLDIGTHAQVY